MQKSNDSQDVVLKVENLHKKFCLHLRRSMAYGVIDTARSMVGMRNNGQKLRPGEFWALNDISLELRRGETLGIMGENGSGKTTLLRLISGIFAPDSGRITVKGRVGALIAVGAGFHPHMTGRENIYLNGTILGMTREEITRRFDDIVDFAEIGGFIDAPVTTYSSGMYVRLGFAIAIHCNPDIIIADEILSVGDYMFQMKCFKRLLEILETGCTVILVSHSEIAMRSVCKKGAIMDAGKLIDVGKIDDMILKYRSLLINRKFGKEQSSIFSPKVGVSTTGGARIYNIEVRDKNGDLIRQNNRELKKLNYSKNSQLSVVFDVEILQEIHNPRVGLYIRDMTKAELTYVCAAVVSKDNFNGRLTLLRGKRRFGFEIDISNLTPNVYTIMTGIADEQYHIKVYDCLDETDRITFEILNSDELVECDALLNRPYYLPKYKFNMEELG